MERIFSYKNVEDLKKGEIFRIVNIHSSEILFVREPNGDNSEGLAARVVEIVENDPSVTAKSVRLHPEEPVVSIPAIDWSDRL